MQKIALSAQAAETTASDFPPELLEAQKNLNLASSLIARYSATGRDESICKKILNSIDKAQKDLVAALKEYKND